MAAANRTLSLLGLARRAGKLALGSEAVQAALRQHRARLVLAAADLSEKTFSQLAFLARQQGVPCWRLACPMTQLSRAVGQNTGTAAVLDAGFARSIGQAEHPQE